MKSIRTDRRGMLRAGTAVVMTLGALMMASGRAEAAVATVTNRNNTGAGSLREAINFANANPGTTIQFNIPTGLALDGVLIISPQTTALPPIVADGTIIDGTTQTAWGGNTSPNGPEVAIAGSLAPVTASGLRIDASNCVVRGIAIYGFQVDGIQLLGGTANNNKIEGCYLGLDGTGSVFSNVQNGVYVKFGSGNVIGGTTAAKRNVFCANQGNGILLEQATNTLVQGNYIGITPDGLSSPGYQNMGVKILTSQGTLVGGTSAAARNIISGNADSGVQITGQGASDNVVSGNYIGTDKNGSAAIPNGFNGVRIESNAAYNTVGGSSSGQRNVISGNSKSGVRLLSANNLVQGNYIGLNAAGTAALPNLAGVEVGWLINMVGGTSGALNIISGNAGPGVVLTGVNTTNCEVRRNYIGTNPAGTAAIPNGGAGVEISGGASQNLVGGLTTDRRNLISGNGTSGVLITGASDKNKVQGNRIGTDATGTAAVPNALAGVTIEAGSQENLVGGAVAGARNVISGNTLATGVLLTQVDTSKNQVAGNFIGTDATGTLALPNRRGIIVNEGAKDNVIGGDTAGHRNVISGNQFWGVLIRTAGTTGTVVSRNFLGLNAAGTGSLSNNVGVDVSQGATQAQIRNNVVSGNKVHGIALYASSNTVQGNLVGTNSAGTAGLPNLTNGIHVDGSNNLIGGLASGEANTVAFNDDHGVKVAGGLGNTIRGNSIHSNNLLGISLGAGNTPLSNDLGDPDSGPNRGQNRPAVQSATPQGLNTLVTVTLNSVPGRYYFIDLYGNDVNDASGSGEGRVYLGTVLIRTFADGNGSGTILVRSSLSGVWLSAVATRQDTGDSSEFGVSVQAP